MSGTISTIVDVLNNIPLEILQMFPTILFVMIVVFAIIIGMTRGFRKSLILFINVIIAAGITFAAFWFIFSQSDFDAKLIESVNQVMGNGWINNQLKVDTNLTSLSQILIEYVTNLTEGDNQFVKLGIEILGNSEAYIVCVVEMLLRFVIFIGLIVVFYVIDFILYILYLIFFKEGRRKRKINNQYFDGISPVPYRKGVFLGGIVGAAKGVIKAFVYFSFLGSFMFIIAGGNYNEEVVRNETETQASEEMQVITNFYNFFKTYGSTGIGKVLEEFKDKNNVPYYLMIADFVSKGYLEDENLEIEEYVLAREELAVLTSIANKALEYAIKNNINIDTNDFLGTLQILLKDPEFEAILVSIVDDLANEKLFKNLAKSCLDSAITAYIENNDNKLVNIIFGGDEPLSITSDVITKDNFKVLLSTVVRTINLLDDMGYGLNNISNIDTNNVLSQLNVYKKEVLEIYSSLMNLSLFSAARVGAKDNKILINLTSYFVEESASSNEVLSTLDMSFIEDINFVDAYDSAGNKVADGELRIFMSLLDGILDSGLLTADFNDIGALVNILVAKDENQKSLVTKLFDSNLVYFTISKLLETNFLGDTMTIYIPEDCKTVINTRSFIKKEELIVTVDVLATLLSHIDIEKLQGDEALNEILSLDKDVILGLLDSRIIQGTIAITLNSDLSGDIIIPEHLQFYNILTDGSYEVDENDKKIINIEKINRWLDNIDAEGNLIKNGEVRNALVGILDLNIIDLIVSDTSSINPSVFFNLTEAQIIGAFKSDILRYTVTNYAETSLNNDQFTIVIPEAAMEASEGTLKLAITGKEFYKLLESFKVIAGYDSESDEEFDINSIEFNVERITDNKDKILASSIIHASIIQMMYDMANENGQISIPDEFKSDLVENNVRNTTSKSKLVTDFYNTNWFKKQEVSNMLEAIKTLGVTDLNNIDNVVNNIGDVLKDESKIDLILLSYVIELTLIDNVYRTLEQTDIVVIPSRLLLTVEVRIANLPNWQSERNSNGTLSTPGEIKKLITALDELGLTEAFKSQEGEDNSFNFKPEDVLIVEDDNIRNALLSEIISYTFTKQICDMTSTEEKDGVLTVPNAVFADGKTINDLEKYIIADEVINMIHAINAILPDGESISSLNIKINDIIGKGNEEKLRTLVTSKIIHATLIQKISELTTGNGGMVEVIFIPTKYDDPLNTDTGNLITDFNNNSWVLNDEIFKLLRGIGALDLEFADDNSTNFDFTVINELNEQYDENMSETRLEIICSSLILHYTLSKKIPTASDIIVVLDEVYDNIDGDKYIFKVELSNLVNSFSIMNINVNNASDIQISSIFKVNSDESYNSADEKIADLLQSRIFEATIAKKAYETFENTEIEVISRLVIDSELNNIDNWLSTRSNDEYLTVINNSWKEVYYLLIACQRLGLGASLDNGDMDLTGGSIILGLSESSITDIMKSAIVSYTLSKQITRIGSLEVSIKAIDVTRMATDSTSIKVLTTNEMQNLIIALRIMTNYDASEGANNEGIDISDFDFEVDDFFELTDKYRQDSDETKITVICYSYIMWLTISKNLFAQGKTSAIDTGHSLLIPNIDEVLINEDTEDFIRTLEINNLLIALKSLFGENASFDNEIDYSIPNEVVLNSHIIRATLSNMLKDDFIRPACTITSTSIYASSPFNIDLINEDDIKELFKALKEILGNSFETPTFSISDGAVDTFIEIFDNEAKYGNQWILLATVSKTILEVNDVPTLTDAQIINGITSYTASAAVMEKDGSNLITMVYLTKNEMVKLFTAFNKLGLDLSGGSLDIPAVQSVFSNQAERDAILESQIAWLILSNLLSSVYDILTTPTIYSLPNPYFNSNINISLDFTVETYNYIICTDTSKEIIHPNNIIAAFTGSIPSGS